MIKRVELEAAARGEGCLGRSDDEEPVFILVARDRCAPKTVRQWVENAKNLGCINQEKLDTALALANQMDRWQIDNAALVKVPD